jgi:hypothetical protein
LFRNIPVSMQIDRQWMLWRLEKREGQKDTKVPYNFHTNNKGDVTNPAHWTEFANVANLPFACKVACDPKLSPYLTGYSGIGYVFVKGGKKAGIDLDNAYGDKEVFERQLKVFNNFQSYSEISQSGEGLHIIVEGEVETGRRRAGIELYSSARFFAMTGNVYQNRTEIKNCQAELTALWEQMGGDAKVYTYEGDGEQLKSDDEIVAMANAAVNSGLFAQLDAGDWQGIYPSQSEADFAFVDIVAFYTQNREQIRRIFRASKLGQTPKDNYQHRGDRAAYVEYMVKKSFDRQLPPIDMDAFTIAFNEKMRNAHDLVAKSSSVNMDAFDNKSNNVPLPSSVKLFPGLLGDIASYIFANSPTPVKEIAVAGAIGLMAGICGRAYNISGTGLNQYVLLLAQTGTGKEAMSDGIAQLMNAVGISVKAAGDFRGPGELASAPGLIRCFERTPSIFSIIGEFGLALKDMSDNRNTNKQGVKRALLQLFNKSGKGNLFDFTGYSDTTKNIPVLLAPAFTILGESTPQTFYNALDENMIAQGLLPRFIIIEYKGKVPYYDKNFKKVEPPFALVERVATLCGICLQRQAQNTVVNVELDAASKDMFDLFSTYATDQVNLDNTEAMQQLWSRANMKALKFAGLIAVGVNPINPLITKDIAQDAIDLITKEIKGLMDKFVRGEIGEQPISESNQAKDLVRIIKEYGTKKFEYWRTYGVKLEMYDAGVIPYSAIQRRLVSCQSYKSDVKTGATSAIIKQLKLLVDADDLKEVARGQMQSRFGTIAKAYVVANPDRFV